MSFMHREINIIKLLTSSDQIYLQVNIWERRNIKLEVTKFKETSIYNKLK